MGKIYLPIICLMILLAACGSSNTGNVPTSVVHSVQTSSPIPTATTSHEPILQSYYLYKDKTTLIFLDFFDGKAERASTTSQDTVEGKHCLMTYEDDTMIFTRTDNRLSIQSLYISGTPFVINADGSLVTNETDLQTGALIVERFSSSSIEAFNTALANLQTSVPHC